MPAHRPIEAPSVERLAYRIPDACRAVGIGRTSLYRLVSEGKLRLVKIAGRSLVDAASLRDLVKTGS
jgi:excisionase family DNA binding protein